MFYSYKNCKRIFLFYTINTVNRQCSECDKESSGSEVEHVDTSAPRKLRHCKDELNITSTPPQEIQNSTSPSTPTTSKNSSIGICSMTVTTAPSTPTTPKVNISMWY